MGLARRQACLRAGRFHNILNRLNHRARFEQVNFMACVGYDGMAGIA